MATTKPRAYVRGSYLPFEEDETHEFKGHREIAPEDTPPWAFRNPSERQTRQAISRNLNAFLNSRGGGVVYCGVDDRGRVMGMHLTRYQKDHVLLSVRSALLRYRPAVPSDRHRVTFVPVVSAADVHDPPTEFAYDVGRRSKQHLVFTSNYCWCDADARARSVSGVIPLSYVIEIAILPWADREASLQPYYLTESGQCYVRRQASVLPLTASDCIRITRHEAAALSRRQSEQVALASQRDVAALQARLDAGQVLAPAGRRDCCCSAAPDTPRPPVGTAAEGVVLRNSEGEGGERGTDRPESRSSDTGRAQSSRELSCFRAQSSSTTTELTRSSRELVHSSSSDSGISLSSSSDTGLAVKQLSTTDSSSSKQPSIDLSKIPSAFSDSETTPHHDHSASAPAHATDADPRTSELARAPTLASGIPAVSDRLQEALLSSVCVPPTNQSPVGDTAAVAATTSADVVMASVDGMAANDGVTASDGMTVTDSVTASDSDLPPPGGSLAGTALDGTESDVSLSATGAAGDVSLFDLGESGCSEMSLLEPESAPDRSLLDLGTSGPDLGASGPDLGASGPDRDGSEADVGASEADLSVMDAGMVASETDVGARETHIGVSATYRGACEADWVDSETDEGVIAAGRVGSRAARAGSSSGRGADGSDLGITGPALSISGSSLGFSRSDLGISGSDFGISVADTSLLELESASGPRASQRYTISSAVAAPTPAATPRRLSMTARLSVATESDSELPAESDSALAAEPDSALAAESESDSSPAGEESRPSSVSGPALDSVGACRTRRSAPVMGWEGSPTQGVPAGVWTFPRGIRGRGKALVADGRDLEAVGKAPEVGKRPVVMGKSSEAVGKVLEVVGKSASLRSGTEPAEDSELDSDDSECSWDAGFRPERRLMKALSDSATVV